MPHRKNTKIISAHRQLFHMRKTDKVREGPAGGAPCVGDDEERQGGLHGRRCPHERRRDNQVPKQSEDKMQPFQVQILQRTGCVQGHPRQAHLLSAHVERRMENNTADRHKAKIHQSI